MRSRSRFFPTITLLTLICFLLSATPVPSLTVSEERELSEEFLKYARQSYRFVDDPFIDYYINRLGEKLVSAFPDQPFQFHFYVIENNVYNAFAAPAGHIFINSGLVSAMNSEEELAGILAHEIAHVYCRHLSEKITESKKLSLATLAGITAGIFLGSGAVAIGSAAAGQAASLAYSRMDERQADEIGIQYLAAAGYSPQGLLTVLKKIRDKSWFSVQEIPTYLTTHPGTEERIVYIDTLLASDRFKPDDRQQPDTLDFGLAATIITATCDDISNALKKFRVLLDQDDNDALAHFGYALALSKKSRQQEAVAHLKTALDKNAFHPQILTALGIEYALMGDYDKALNILEKIPDVPYWDYRKHLFLAQAAEQAGHLEKSIAVLETLVEKKPDYADAIYALGMAYGRNDNYEKAHYHLGLYYYKLNDPGNALFHLNKALELTGDPEKRKAIEEMVTTMKKEGRRSPRT